MKHASRCTKWHLAYLLPVVIKDQLWLYESLHTFSLSHCKSGDGSFSYQSSDTSYWQLESVTPWFTQFCSLLCQQYSTLSTLYTILSILCSLYYTLYTLLSILCSLYSALYTLHALPAGNTSISLPTRDSEKIYYSLFRTQPPVETKKICKKMYCTVTHPNPFRGSSGNSSSSTSSSSM